MRATVRFTAAAALLTLSLSVRADEQRAAGLALFEDARKLAAEGKHAEACPKFEEAFGMIGGVGVAYNLADCWERTGKLASAWGMYGKAAALAKDKKEIEKEQLALEKAKALEPRLPHVVIQAPDVPGLEVRWGKVRTSKASLGTPLPVDPGKVTFEASAPGYVTWTQTIDLAEKEERKLVVPSLEREPPPKPTASVSASVSASAPPPPPRRDGAPQRIAGLVVGGAGVVGIGIGAGLGAFAIQRYDQSVAAGCDSQNHCLPAAAALRNEGRAAGDASTASIVIGASLVVAGLVVYLAAPPRLRGQLLAPGRPLPAMVWR